MRHKYESVKTSGEPGDARCAGVPCPAELSRYFQNTSSESVIVLILIVIPRVPGYPTQLCHSCVTEYAPMQKALGPIRYAAHWYLLVAVNEKTRQTTETSWNQLNLRLLRPG
eukprot:3755120-Rhodomonas_salina.1